MSDEPDAGGRATDTGGVGGAPVHRVADVLASDGGTVHLRPITPGDGPALLAFHGALSERTRYLRYFGPYPTMPERDVVYFTTVDHVDRVAVVAELGDDIIAVARYDRLPGTGDGRSAEVAFVVADAHQGRGLGSVLLEHLAAAALDTGVVSRFVAEVLAENPGMVRVFRDAGYQISRSFDGGVLHLEFDIDPRNADLAAALLSVRNARERASEARSVGNVLAPSSVAVIGASNDPDKVGHAVLANLLRGGFRGPVYPVNAEHRAVQGVRAYASVRDIPDDVDLAVVAVPAQAVEEVLDGCLVKGVRALVIVSAGFSESGAEGLAAERRLVHQARAHGMRVVGPSALGVANTDPEVCLNATLAPSLPPHGRVGFFCQSGALGVAILAAAAERGLGLSSFVSAGNRADVSGNDLIQYWGSDPATDVVLLYLESFGNPRKFGRLARELARHKPVVVVKSGHRTSAAGGSPTVADATVSTLLDQAGVIRVDSITELFDCAQLLAHQALPTGTTVAVVGNSSALGLLAGDAALSQGLELAGDPVDVGAGAGPGEFAAAVSAAVARTDVDAVVVVFVPPVATPGAEYARALREAVAGHDVPVVSTFLGAEGILSSLTVFGAGGEPVRGSIPSYPGPERAVAALAHAARYARWRRTPASPPGRPADVDADVARALVDGWVHRSPGGRELSAEETRRVLATYGVVVDAGTGVSPTVTSTHAGTADGAGVGCRIVVADDASFGPVIRFGLSGAIADLLGDTAHRLLPLTPQEAHELVVAPRAAPLLTGYRDSVPVDIVALADLLLRVATLADDLPGIRQLHVEPVIATPSGVTVGGAVVTVGPPPERGDLGPRRLR